MSIIKIDDEYVVDAKKNSFTLKYESNYLVDKKNRKTGEISQSKITEEWYYGTLAGALKKYAEFKICDSGSVSEMRIDDILEKIKEVVQFLNSLSEAIDNKYKIVNIANP